MNAATAEAVTAPDCELGESPVWRGMEGALYWVDIKGRRIHRLDPASGERQSWATAEMPACIAFARDGHLVAGMESAIFSLELEDAGQVQARALAAPSFPMPGMRFNDGKCDRQGRFWAGTLHMDIPAAHAVGALYRYAPGTSLRGPVIDSLLVQNGLAWSPDGGTMYLSDSHPTRRLIWAFDYDRDLGLPSNQRVLVDMNLHAPGRPDGAAVDADGGYWICATDAGRVMRFTPKGVLDRTLELPVRKPTMCAFGGSSLDTLYVTSMRPAPEAERAAQPLAGAVFALRPGVQGLPEPEYQNRGDHHAL